MRKTIVLATRNQGKIVEIRRLLAGGPEVLGLDSFPHLEDVEETGATFEENALLKAGYAARQSGLTALADDSGLEVMALGGAPGVRSARFYLEAPTHFCPEAASKDAMNNAWLLERLKNTPAGQRAARFCSVIAAVHPNGDHISAAGFWSGQVAFAPLGQNGFGYDPLFLDPELGLTAGQMDLDIKNSRSHRAAALRALAALWPAFWARGEKP